MTKGSTITVCDTLFQKDYLGEDKPILYPYMAQHEKDPVPFKLKVGFKDMPISKSSIGSSFELEYCNGYKVKGKVTHADGDTAILEGKIPFGQAVQMAADGFTDLVFK